MIVDTNVLSAWAEGDSSVEPGLQLLSAHLINRCRRLSVELGLRGTRQSLYRNINEEWLAQYLPMGELVAVAI